MSDENQDSTKIPNINKEEREWVSIKLIGLKPREVYEPFLETFPRLAGYADEHGISDEELKRVILRRFYNINQRRNLDIDEVSAFEALTDELTGGVRLVEFDLKYSRKDV